MTATEARSTVALSRQAALERASRLVPVLKERALETERLRRLPPETVRDLVDSQLLRLGVPDRFGGLGLDYDLSYEVSWELGRGCGSTAWCYGLWVLHTWMVGHFPERGQEDYFADGPNALCSSAFNGARAHTEPV